MSWNPYWRLPPSHSIEGNTNGGKEEKESYGNFLKELSPEDLETYTKLLPPKTDDYGMMIFNEVKPKVGGRRKKLRKTRAKKIKRKTRRNK